MSSFQAPVGTRDILFPESARVEHVVATFAGLARRFGYGLIVSPMFEDVGVFRRGVGEASEVVTKEMYQFEDKGGRTLALRPEGTASIIRAYVQHRPVLPYKAWYLTPAFRYERPQAGRYRQHHQLGVEALGSEDPGLDVEVIVLLRDYLAALGLSQVSLLVNSMGDRQCLPPYKDLLAGFFADHEHELCDEHQKTYRVNPLRVLDCKRPSCKELRLRAPRLAEHLCAACSEHFEKVKSGLSLLHVDYRTDDFLVRGFDYYTRTTFEFQADFLDSAQNALGGGGRYDGLVENLGGPPTPGIGFGTGLERVLIALEQMGIESPRTTASVFVVDLTGGDEALLICEALRRAGYAADRAYDARSLKAQLRQADRSGAELAVIIGDKERADKTVSLRRLRGDDREQLVIERDALMAGIKELLS